MTNARRAKGHRAWARAALFVAFAVLLGCADTPFAAPPSHAPLLPLGWAPLGRMLLERIGYTATLLPSGKVLIAGGHDHGGHGHDTAELYDPDTGAFVAAQHPMFAPRSGHTATLLPTGQVLLAGGNVTEASMPLSVSTAELYDPVTGEFIYVGRMLALHRHHTATLLPSGAVLIIGGDSSQNDSPKSPAVPTNQAEILPAGHARAFQPAGSMLFPRAQHTATLLPDGQVLVVGGFIDAEQTKATQSAERYSPVTGSFTQTSGSTRDPRAQHTATLMPSGLVLIAGSLLIDPKLSGPKPQDRAEIYVPLLDTFSAAVPPGVPSLTNFAIPTNGAATLLPSNEVLLVGAKGSGSAAVLFDDATRSFQAAPGTKCAYTAGGQTATLLPSAGVLLLGGIGSDSASGCAEIYDRSKAAVRQTATPMEAVRSDHQATLLLSGKILITGGSGALGGASEQAEVFNPATLTFEKTATPMTAARSNHTATLLLTGEVLITGGSTADPKVPSAELYHPDCQPVCFESLKNGLNVPRTGHTATLLLSGKVLIVGGAPSAASPGDAELYDPGGKSFSVIPTNETTVTLGNRSNHTATRLADGRVLLAGGDGLVSAAIYDGRTSSGIGAFSPTGSMRSGHAETGKKFAATLLPSGKVLVVGLDSAELFGPDDDSGLGAFSPAATPALPAPSGLSATLLPTGKVLIAGESSTQVYDPAAGLFTPSVGLWEARVNHTATLLPTGQTLLTGGAGLKTAVLWGPVETAATEARRPILTSTPDEAGGVQRGEQTITGERLVARAETSSGARTSPGNYPIVRVLPVMGGAITGDLGAWSPTQATWSLPASKLSGPGLLFVITNGIASEGRPIMLGATTTCRSNLDCNVGLVCQFSGKCGEPKDPATTPMGCTFAAAGRSPEGPLGAVAAALLLMGSALRRRGRRRGLLLPLILAGLTACGGPSSVAPSPAVSRSPIPETATHLLVVRSASWDTTTARLSRHERAAKGWAQVGASIDVVLGHGGMGWGRGNHGDGAPAGMAGPVKREGDGRSPAGVFTIGGVYGYDAMPPAGTRVPYVRVTDTWRCVDDSASSRYNQVFDAASVTSDWSSAEVMLRDDVFHTRVVVVEHNTRPARPGSGSCIFLHVWGGPASTTTGCTAMALDDLEAVVTFLVDDATVLVQLQEGAYTALAGSWGLPL